MLHALPSSNGVRNAVRIALWSCLLALSPLTSLAAPSITLAWDPSPDPSVIGYKVYWGVATRNYTNSLSAGSATTLTISNLAIGPTYYFAATAFDTNGIESDYSVEASGAVVLPNQQPTLNVISPVTINEGAGTQTVNLSGITSGATNENQTLTVTATSSNTGLIPNPTVNYTSPSTTGSLTFAPVAFQNGTSTITVTVNDGAASNNIISRTFLVTVNPVNQAPTLNALANVTVQENSGPQTINLSGITSGATNEVQTLTISATSSNTSLITNPTVSYTSPNSTGSITFTPVAFGVGTTTIAVTVNDGGASNNIVSRSFTVTVNGVNQQPTLNQPVDVVVNENGGTQTVNLSGISSGATNEFQTLTVTATSANPALIPNPTVTYTSPNATGSLTFAPVAFASGNTTVTVTVNDGGASNNIISRTFNVTVNPVNQVPTLNALTAVTINENAGVQTVNLLGISSGATNESQTLTVTATSTNTALIPNPTVSYTSPNSTGSLTFAPVTYGFGTSLITVTVNDGGTSNNIASRSFLVTVNAVNQQPTLDPVLDVTINENAPVQSVGLTGVSSGAPNESQVLSVNASSSNTGLIPAPTVTYTSPNSTGSLSFKPVTNQFGTAIVTVTVRDSGTSNNLVTRTFNVTVNAVNNPPVVSAITNRVIAVSTSTAAIPFTVSDVETPAGSLTVSASSDDPAIVPVSGIVFGGSGGNRTVTVTPANGQTGVVNITITVSDGTDSSSTTFQLTVAPKPAAPGNFHLVSQ
jgi:Bacterial Ig domain